MTRFTDWLMSDPDGQAVMTLACCFLLPWAMFS